MKRNLISIVVLTEKQLCGSYTFDSYTMHDVVVSLIVVFQQSYIDMGKDKTCQKGSALTSTKVWLHLTSWRLCQRLQVKTI